jgi:hypothetical protein
MGAVSHLRKQTNEMMQILEVTAVSGKSRGEGKTGLLIELRAVDAQTGWSSRCTADGVRRISGIYCRAKEHRVIFNFLHDLTGQGSRILYVLIYH